MLVGAFHALHSEGRCDRLRLQFRRRRRYLCVGIPSGGAARKSSLRSDLPAYSLLWPWRPLPSHACSPFLCCPSGPAQFYSASQVPLGAHFSFLYVLPLQPIIKSTRHIRPSRPSDSYRFLPF